MKPYFENHYAVYDGSLDLYGYFLECGINLLKQDGRLGFISSSTFFRTGSGENLRRFLAEHAGLESVVDFGDLQLFEGVTTYPTILSARKVAQDISGDLAFLNVKDHLPDDLGRAFVQSAKAMPRARLGAASWRFEDDALARLRDKIATGRKTLGEVYGAPLYGIKTGLNEAFVIDHATRDRLVAADPKSAELLKPFLRGEDVKRWRVEPDDFWIIFARQGTNIDNFPAIKTYLNSFRSALEPRPKDWLGDQWSGRKAGHYKWYELQDTVAYWHVFEHDKIIFTHFMTRGAFALDQSKFFSNNKTYVIDSSDLALLAILNSSPIWWWFTGISVLKRGGYREATIQHVEKIPIPEIPAPTHGQLSALAQTCTDAARARFSLQSTVRHRILDLAPPERRKLNGKLENWHELSFNAFRDEVKKAFHADIPVKERGDWETYLAGNSAEVRRLSDMIAAAEREIDAIVYRLFDLTPDEIALLEASLAGQY